MLHLFTNTVQLYASEVTFLIHSLKLYDYSSKSLHFQLVTTCSMVLSLAPQLVEQLMAMACSTVHLISHPMETMQVFGRIDNTKQQLGKTSQVEQFRSAYLCCLQSMVVLRTRCGRDIWHLNFANTLHVPDATRNTHNWSWVHGP